MSWTRPRPPAGSASSPWRAAAQRRGGKDAAGCVADAQAARDALKMWFAVDTLEFLKRSGRIGGAAALIGTTLKIKPILTLEAEITPVERVRTSRRAFERLVDYARQRKDSGADGWVVQHIQAGEQAERLVDACREVFELRAAVRVRGRARAGRAHRAGPARRGRRAALDGLLARALSA